MNHNIIAEVVAFVLKISLITNTISDTTLQQKSWFDRLDGFFESHPFWNLIAGNFILPILLAVLFYVLRKLDKKEQTRSKLGSFADINKTGYTRYFVPNEIEIEEGGRKRHISSQDSIEAIAKLLNTNKHEKRYYYLVAPTGVGKTTFLVNLYLHLNGNLFSRIWNRKRVLIANINDYDELEEALSQIKQKRKNSKTILLLDGLDEYKSLNQRNTRGYWNDFKTRWKENEVHLKGFSKIIIAVREQFLQPTTVQDGDGITTQYINGAPIHHLRLLPFGKEQKQNFISKKYGSIDPKKYQEIIQTITWLNDTDNSVLGSPLVLSYLEHINIGRLEGIVKKLNSENNLQITVYNAGRHLKRYLIYRAIVDEWLEREINDKGYGANHDKYKSLFKRFCTGLAYEMTHGSISKKEGISITNYIKYENVKISEEIILGLGDRSLLRKRSIDGEELMQFAHPSFTEFMLVEYALENREHEQQIQFAGYSFAMEMFIALRWNLSRNNHPAKKLKDEEGICHLTKTDIEEWVTFIDSISCNQHIISALEDDIGGLLNKDRPESDVWLIEFKELSNIEINNDNYIEGGAPYTICEQFCRYFKNKIKYVFLKDAGLADSNLACFNGIDSVQVIDLYNNKIVGVGLKNFKESAKCITRLSLSNNKITDEYLEAFAGADKIQELFLWGNNLDGTGLKNFKESAKCITKLHLGENRITDEYLEAFSGADKIQELYLWRNKLDGTGLKYFKESAKCITKLYLNENGITDKYLEAFSGADKIQELYLWGNDLDGSGLKNFKDSAKSIIKLYLSDNRITDECLEAFSGADKIQELYLWGNNLYGTGLIYFKDSLKSLTSINVRNLNINDEGQFSVFAGINRLKELHVQANGQDGSFLEYFLSSSETLKTLRLSQNPITPKYFHYVLRFKNLEELHISEIPEQDDNIIQELISKGVKVKTITPEDWNNA